MHTKESLAIIAAERSHAGYLAAFGKQSFIDAYLCELTYEELAAYADVAFAREAIEGEISGALAHYFICEDRDATPCGYLKLLPSPPPACIPAKESIEIQRLYVAEGHKGMGVGGRLYRHGEAFARARGMHNLWLRVWEGNGHAKAIYERWGYTTVGEEPYRVKDEARTVLLMHKAL